MVHQQPRPTPDTDTHLEIDALHSLYRHEYFLPPPCFHVVSPIFTVAMYYIYSLNLYIIQKNKVIWSLLPVKKCILVAILRYALENDNRGHFIIRVLGKCILLHVHVNCIRELVIVITSITPLSEKNITGRRKYIE